MRSEEDRPVHLVIDVSKGTRTEIPITDREWDEIEQRGRNQMDREAAEAAEAAATAAAVAAHPDPLVQLLARKAGLA